MHNFINYIARLNNKMISKKSKIDKLIIIKIYILDHIKLSFQLVKSVRV